jgi:uroporphyrinogen-III synthase
VNIWITRSEPGASRQARALEAAGYRCLIAPVLEIEPVAGGAPVGIFDLVIFLSEHAVRHGLPRLMLGGAELLAVGARTAEVLAAAGHGATHPARADSEGLLGLPALADVAGRRILLVCGEGGRMLLAETLTARGARVERFVCYRRRVVAAIAEDLGAADAIVAGSAEGVSGIARFWFAAGCSAGVPLLVPSARVRARAVALGFRNVHDCHGADSAAVLRGLADVSGAGTA